MDLDRPHFRTTSTGSSSTTATTTSELFICFASRLSSSSSMKLTKSILSPGRAARDGGSGGPASLSSSLSRRLRTNGSLKGGASPFFTTTGKKRGCAFENPEPSSPKVTCIGQVRVKTKKKVKQSRSLSKRRSGEASFRKIEHQASGDGGGGGGHQSEQQRYSNASGGAHYHQQQQQPQECLPHRSQRWVHLPVSICEALSCLFPCKSSCFSTSGEAEKSENEKQQNGSENGCGAVFARWLVSVNDGEGGKRREIELVVGGGDEAEERVSVRSSRRHVFEDIEVKDDRIEVKGMNIEDGGGEEEARVSICIPPKNALLLMRCRSDPLKMADLASRFSWDAHSVAPLKTENEDIEEEDFEEQDVATVISAGVEQQCEGFNKDGVFEEEDVAVFVEESNCEEEQEIVIDEVEANLEMEVLGDNIVNEEDIEDEELVINSSEKMVEEEENEIKELQQEKELGNVETFSDGEDKQDDEEEVESNMSSFEHLLDHQLSVEDCAIDRDIKEEVEDSSNSICHLSPSTESDEENLESNNLEAANDEETEDSNIDNPEKVAILINDGEEEFQVKIEPETTHHNTENGEQRDKEEDEKEEQTTTLLPNESEMVDEPENQEPAVTTVEEEPKKKAKDRSQMLPECLLLMMCEPKLSMEVSKETWVCSTDFVRWLPERPRKHAKSTVKAGGACDHALTKRRLSVDSRLKPVAAHRAAAVADQNGYMQPPRSSCSLPAAAAAASMATMIEQKLVNAVGYEPFVLTRCKSEPMKTAAAKLLPESCFWKNAVSKLEPHRQAALGVGAAGVGF